MIKICNELNLKPILYNTGYSQRTWALFYIIQDTVNELGQPNVKSSTIPSLARGSIFHEVTIRFVQSVLSSKLALYFTEFLFFVLLQLYE